MHQCLCGFVNCAPQKVIAILKSCNLQVKAKLEALEDAIKLMQVRQLVQDMTGRHNLKMTLCKSCLFDK